MKKMSVMARIHSKGGAIEPVRILVQVGDNNYFVVTKDGVRCSAIFNPFQGLFFADDIYGVQKLNHDV